MYKPVINGVAVSVESFRNSLLAKGHQVYVFAPESPEQLPPERFVIRYPAFDLPIQKYPLVVPISPFADLFIETAMPDVLHAHHPSMLGRAAVNHSERHELPLVFSYHTRYHDYAHYAQPFPKDRVRELITHWLGHFMASCHHLVVPSESIRELVARIYGIEKQVSVVATGIDPARFEPGRKLEFRGRFGWEPDEVVFVSCGRLAEEKNFELLLKAFSLLPETPRWRLAVLGEGDHRGALLALRDSLGLQARVEFLGLIASSQVPSYLAAADVFCFASVTETQGLVTLEAMASGAAVVAVDASGTRDAVDDGVDGLLTRVSADALAQGLRALLEQPELRLKLAASALDKAHQYRLENQTDKLVEVYRCAQDACRARRRLHPHLHSHWEAFLDFFRVSSPF
ncbi:MAG: glycosyltransferase [Vulcanimicrobiota bacterium]